jgi:ribosome-associated toxin RatA of RatAB toxin-antitoxin module
VPDVRVELEVRASAGRVWGTVLDVDRFAESMSSVRWVRLLDNSPAARRTAWSVELKGSILEWEEEEHLDHAARTIRFHQISGDLDVFDGRWVVEELGPDRSRVRFDVTFEIGIPLLAEMLNPVAVRSLGENCAEMLKGIERTAVEV